MSEVESADILIFTTPTYCLRASAPMKSFIDLTFNYWMSHRPRKCMFHKKAIVISTAAGTGAKKLLKISPMPYSIGEYHIYCHTESVSRL